jgi:DNA (cytosine-5)-methyltransferase 1
LATGRRFVTLTVGSLFAGIGGFDLGLSRAYGFRTVWLAEQEPYRRRVLRQRFPAARIVRDVHHVSARALDPVDVLCGGFPCQDLSDAGLRAGISGRRSGLWTEFARIIGEFQPRWVLIENVVSLRRRGLATVLQDLATLGFDAEWATVAAADVGAPHQRDRLWIVGYPRANPDEDRREHERDAQALHEGTPRARPGAPGERRSPGRRGPRAVAHRPSADAPRIFTERFWHEVMAHAESFGQARDGGRRAIDLPPDGGAEGTWARPVPPGRGLRSRGGVWPEAWEVEPRVGRVADGIPAQLDRLGALGDSLVPQIVTLIGRAMLRAESETGEA